MNEYWSDTATKGGLCCPFLKMCLVDNVRYSSIGSYGRACLPIVQNTTALCCMVYCLTTYVCNYIGRLKVYTFRFTLYKGRKIWIYLDLISRHSSWSFGVGLSTQRSLSRFKLCSVLRLWFYTWFSCRESTYVCNIKAFQTCVTCQWYPLKVLTLKVGTRVVDTGLNVCSVCI